MKIHSILARDKKWGIAQNGRLPWDLPREYGHFKRLGADTSHLPTGVRNVFVMGRKTWEAEGPEGPSAYPFSSVYNFVLSKNLKETPKGANALVSSVEQLVQILESPQWSGKIGRVFNIGGGEVYKYIHDSKYCGRVYATRINEVFPCDTFCPRLDGDPRFKVVQRSEPYEEIIPEGVQKENGLEWEVIIYEKISQ